MQGLRVACARAQRSVGPLEQCGRRHFASSAAGKLTAQKPVVIVGGGAMGSAAAYALARRANAAVVGGNADYDDLDAPQQAVLPVTIIERDPTYEQAASALAVGCVALASFLRTESLML